MIATPLSPLDFAPLSWRARPLFDRPLCLSPDAAAFLAREPDALNAYGDEADGDERRPHYRLDDGIATIPVRGALVNRDTWLTRAFGVATYQSIAASLRQAIDDPSVRRIVLDLDSPGGEAAGAPELSDLVREVSIRKPVTAFVNAMAVSSAYWIATGASEVVVMPSATVGSIGVVWLHLDHSAAFTAAGIRPTLLHAGKYKIDGAETHPLDPKARARIQEQIDQVHDLFTASVGKHRPILGAAGAKATEGGVFMGAKAVAAGLADRVAASPLPLPPGSRAPLPPIAASPSSATDLSAVVGREEEAAREAAVKQGAEAETARVRAILECDEAKDKPKFARLLALETEVGVEEAKGLLAVAGTEKQFGSRMARVPDPGLRPDSSERGGDPQAGIDRMWADLAEQQLGQRPGATSAPRPRKTGQS